MTQVTVAPTPIARLDRLGCGIPRAEIWTRGLGSRVLEVPELLGATYGYKLSDTSLAEVKISNSIANGPRCRSIASVRPWKHELVIYRDDVLAWSGPIVRMPMSDGLTLQARDLSSWLDHRNVHKTHIYGGQGVGEGNTDTTTIFTDLVTDAMAPDTSPGLILLLNQVSGVLAQGNYTPAAFKAVGPLLRELAKGSIDWYVIDRWLHYAGGGASAPPSGSPVDVTGASIANPGFETNTTGWSNALNTIARVTTQAHAGSASCEITTYTFAISDTVTTITNLIVGKSYTVRGWFFGTGAPSRGRNTHLECAGVSGADFSYQLYHGAPSTWLQASVTFIATATSHVLKIHDELPGSGAHLYFDDFTISLNNPDLPPAPPGTTPTRITLTDDDLVSPAEVTLDGLYQETRSLVTGQQTGGDSAFYGESPAPAWTLDTYGPGLTADQTEFGLLEGSTTSTLADQSAAQAQAAQRNTLRGKTPVILSGFTLSRDARVTFDQLVPGALVDVQLDRPCIEVRATMILRQVEVSAQPSGEQVTLTLEPSGLADEGG